MSKIIAVILWLYAIACTVALIANPHWLPPYRNGVLCGAIVAYICAIFCTVGEIFFFKP